MRGDGRRDVEPAQRTPEETRITATKPAEAVTALALVTLHEMAAAAEEQDGAGVRVGKVDRRRHDWNGDPAVGLELSVDVGSPTAIVLAPLTVARGRLDAAVLETTVQHDFGLRVVGERTFQGLIEVHAGTGNDDQHRPSQLSLAGGGVFAAAQ